MIKTINTGVAELVLVKVPDKSHKHLFTKIHGDNDLVFYIENEFPKVVTLPSGNYKLLGIAHDMTEEVWDTIVDKLPCLDSFPYKDYGYKDAGWDGFEWFYQTATESGMSLLKANGVFLSNPNGDIPPEYDCPAQHIWEKAQKTTGKWVVLKKNTAQ